MILTSCGARKPKEVNVTIYVGTLGHEKAKSINRYGFRIYFNFRIQTFMILALNTSYTLTIISSKFTRIPH